MSDPWLRGQYFAAFEQLEYDGLQGRLTTPEELHLIKILRNARDEMPEDPVGYVLENLPSVKPSLKMLAKGLAASAWDFCKRVGTSVLCSSRGRSKRRNRFDRSRSRSRSPSPVRQYPSDYDSDLARQLYRRAQRSPSPMPGRRRSRSPSPYRARRFTSRRKTSKAKRKSPHTRRSSRR